MSPMRSWRAGCASMGLEETKVSIASKLSRGSFAATFFIATMKAIERQTVNLEEI